MAMSCSSRIPSVAWPNRVSSSPRSRSSCWGWEAGRGAGGTTTERCTEQQAIYTNQWTSSCLASTGTLLPVPGPTCSTNAEDESERAAPITTASSTVRSSARAGGACSTFSRNCGRGIYSSKAVSSGGGCKHTRLPNQQQKHYGTPATALV